MIDVENQVFHFVAGRVREAFSKENILVKSEYDDAPARFPAATILEADNSVYQKMRTDRTQTASPAAATLFENNLSSGSNLVWYCKKSTGSSGTLPYTLQLTPSGTWDGSNLQPFTQMRSEKTFQKGETSQGRVSSRNASAYPANGTNSAGTIWYESLGSDSIDPLGISYSAQSLKPGESVTVTIQPGSPSLGGTVSYQYSYRTTANGSWTNWGSKTTDLSKTYTVSTTAKIFQVRVLASDGWGFTSATYVTGSSVPVESTPPVTQGGKLYVGVNGRAREVVKIYIGVNNVARLVTSGYVGVAEIARKFI